LSGEHTFSQLHRRHHARAKTQTGHTGWQDPRQAFARLARNADVAEVEVDDPWRWSRARRFVALRSIRNDPLGRLHSHRQIDEAQYQSGRAFQNDWEKAERGPQAVDPSREYVDGARTREPVTEAQRKAVLPAQSRPNANLAPTAPRWFTRLSFKA